MTDESRVVEGDGEQSAPSLEQLSAEMPSDPGDEEYRSLYPHEP